MGDDRDDGEPDPGVTGSRSAGTAGAADGSARTDDPGDREVVVPMRLYKTVTVFSTLLAVAAILVGFVLLDRGTRRATAGPEEVSLPVVAIGLAFIVGGSAVYAFSTRFRAEGMGKSKDDTGEQSNNG